MPVKWNFKRGVAYFTLFSKLADALSDGEKAHPDYPIKAE